MTTSARPSRSRRTSRPSGDEREQAILATAERLLEERQFTEISVDDLAKGAGLSRPTFYFYFKSKEAVLLTLLEPLIARADAEFDGAIQRVPMDPRRMFRGGIKAFVAAFSSHRAVSRAGLAVLATSAEFRTMWSAAMQRWIDHTEALIVVERTRGAAPDTIPARDLATSLNLMNERAIMTTLSADQHAIGEERLVDTLSHIWLSSIYGDPQ